MKLKKILSGILAAMMTISAVSLTAIAQDEKEASSDELVIPYSKIQKGNVDRKIKAEIDAAYSDPEKGTVVKITPIPTTAEKDAVNVDGYGMDSLKVDITKYNYFTVEYKLVSSYGGDIIPYFNFLPGTAKVLSKNAQINSNEVLVRNEWATATFNMGGLVKPLINPGKQYISQVHFYPFGNIAATNLSADDYLLIGNVTFMVDNPNGDVFYTLTFDAGDKNAQGTAPEPISATFETELVLPEIPFTNGEKEPMGWLYGTKMYQPGDTFLMPEKDTRLVAIWKDVFVAKDLVELNFPQYSNGICNHKDTAFLETLAIDGYDAVSVTPNHSSEVANTAINLDGWSYSGARINAEYYKTIAVLYKYVSDNPVKGKTNLNIMTSGIFSKATNMVSREEIVANRWAIASFDLTAAVPNIKEGTEPIIKQMHYYPLGSAKVEALDKNDKVYVAKIYAIPEASTKASLNESFMKGYDDGTFGVSGNMTRAEACTIVARLSAGSDSAVPADKTTAFTDVAKDQWYHKYVSYVESLGYLKSYSGNFLPNQAITRAEFVELVYNMGLLTDAGKNGTFTDVPADHARANVIAAAGKAGLVNGYDNGDGTFSFKPDATITRAEVVKVINNAYGKKPNVEGMFETAIKDKFKDVTPDHWAYADILSATISHIAYLGEKGYDEWMAVLGGAAIAEDFDPDFEAGKAKATEALALMDKRIEEIKNTPSAKFDITGKTYYVSTSGNDANDGLSEATPFKTATKASQTATYGDMVLFKRGDEWRERWAAKSGVTYSAYGEGAKPYFNGNLFGDAADESLWTLVEGTTNIWQYKNKTKDVGNIVINGGEKTIEKLVTKIENSRLTVGGSAFDPKTSFALNNYFASTYDVLGANTVSLDSDGGMGYLYVRCDEGNPGKVYDSIEIVYRGNLISVPSNVTMDNIKIRYSGSHGFGMGTVKNVKFTNLEVGYIGGSAQHFNNSNMTRFGNGIEVYGGCDGFIIENCYVYQCYDAGITHQLSKGGTNECIHNDVLYANNVIDKCIYNIEYFMGAPDADNVERIMKNVEYSGNILARSGYGWGMSPGRSASVKGWEHYNRSENFVIKNNTFLLDRVNACDLSASMSVWVPTFEGNTYIQKYGNSLTKVVSQLTFNGSAAQSLEYDVGETGFSLFYLPADTVVE